MQIRKARNVSKKALTSGRIEGGEVVSGDIILPGEPVPAARRQRPVSEKKADRFVWNPSIIEFTFGDSAVSWTDQRTIFNNDVSSILSKIDDALDVLRLQDSVDQLRRIGTIRLAHVAIGTSAWPQIEA